MSQIDTSELQKIIIGRVVPYIYSFETNTLPNYLKVGDTYRPVEERLSEWRRYYKDLKEVSRHKATINDEVFFRDYSVHKYLQQKGVTQIPLNPIKNIHSNEFFEGAKATDISDAVDDIVKNFKKSSTYEYYSNIKNRVEYHHERIQDFKPRQNQQKVIDAFGAAVKKGRTNLLMYAVMRFGKSTTSIWSARSIDSKLTVIVSAKADVHSEWKSTVESHKDFKGYRFLDKSDLKEATTFSHFYGKKFGTGGGNEEVCTNIVLFLTLQDLAGSSETIKRHHKILKNAHINLLIIDETHFGARAPVLGKILAGVEIDENEKKLLKKGKEESEQLGALDKLEAIKAEITLHLSGTPYRILMGSEFKQEDIIAFVQFSDIYEAKLRWGIENLDKNEWNNPYYGFPQMVRFAFNPNESSRKKLDDIPGSKPADLFTPVSTDKSGNYETFEYEQEVIDLLEVLDGSKNDTNMLGLLNNETIKAGKLAQHIVIVLPFRASCDALEKLITKNKKLFKNIANYKLVNISGYNQTLSTPEEIKTAIIKAQEANQKTITLTVNKMLTGSTVPQWDTMIYLKSTASPQDYDQAIFRLQSPWIETYKDESGNIIKYDMKPQTLLVDLDPTRLFRLQEMKAFAYGVNTQNVGNEHVEEFIKRELIISPIIALNAEGNKLVEVTATTIIDEVRKYAYDRTITEDVQEIGIDVSLKDNRDIFEVINRLAELGGKSGLNIRPNIEEGEELNGVALEGDVGEGNDVSTSANTVDIDKGVSSFEKRFRTYYVMILLFAFLSTTEEKSLTDIIKNIDASEDNRRIARNLGLRRADLVLIREHINPLVRSTLDYKIQNADFRGNDDSITPVEHIDIAIHKFGRLSDAEVFTPEAIVSRMYDGFDKEFLRDAKNTKILDIASKSGSFAKGFVEKAKQHGIKIEDIKDNFYSIPTSPAAYEFTRKMYDALGLNVDNIVQHFDSYDLIKLTEAELQSLLSQNKKFNDISLRDLEGPGKMTYTDDMKFTAIVGNPPYQENIQGRGDQPPIYHRFLEAAYRLSDKVTMIHPARFLFNAGLTPKDWNKKMLQDPHLKVVYFEQDSAKVFPNTDIKGGVVITFRDTEQNFGAIDVFTSLPELNTILRKVEGKLESTLDKIITGRGVYRLTETALLEHPEIEKLQSVGHKSDVGSGAFKILKNIILFEGKPNDNKEYVQVIGLYEGLRQYYWIDRRYLNGPGNFTKHKVIVPKANGSGEIGEVLSTPLIGEPLIGYTETFIGIGAFDTKFEAEAALKYTKSKFARTMLGVLKVTQDNPRDKWAKVPLQDFTKRSDIDWTKSIADIDKQLYKKYGLDKQEVEFIETRVKAMN